MKLPNIVPIKLKRSWTYRNPKMIIILSLIVVILVQNYGHIITEPIEEFNRSRDITYIKPEPKVSSISTSLTEEERIAEWAELRAREIVDAEMHIYLEEARFKALNEYGEKIIYLTGQSPFVEYDHLEQRIYPTN